MATRRIVYAGGRTGRNTSRSVDSILYDYKQFVKVTKRECRRIMKEAADIVLEKTLPYVPRDTGALQESGRAEAHETAKGISAKVSFGGPNSPVTPTKNAPVGIVDYAVIVHEDAEGWSKGIYKSGEFKFLEKGTIEAQPDVDAFIKSELRKFHSGGGRGGGKATALPKKSGGKSKSKAKLTPKARKPKRR